MRQLKKHAYGCVFDQPYYKRLVETHNCELERFSGDHGYQFKFAK